MSPEAGTIRVLVVDDEPVAREGLRQLAAGEPDLEVVGECGDAAAAVERLGQGGIDLVFLDVRMPGGSGIEVVERLGVERMPEVVFVTAFDEFAVRAFELAALDYLTKPVERVRFAAAVERFRRRRDASRRGDLVRELKRLLATGPGGSGPPRLALRTGSRLTLIDEAEVDWIEAEEDYARVHHGGASHLLSEPLGSLEARLTPGRFVRVHRSVLVALPKVRQIRFFPNGTARVQLDGVSDALPVSRRYRATLEAALVGSPLARGG